MKIKVLDRPAEIVQQTWEGVTRDRAKQWCLLEVDGLPTAFQISNDPDKVLSPGEYELAPQSFAVANGRLTLSRVVLVAVAQPKLGGGTKAAAA